jgi:multidrug efflux pump
MTSSSGLGSTNVTLQFELSRDVDAAARDVQAAINAARGQLPANLPSNPNYRKVNPADAPALIIALTSDTVPRSQIYDITSTVLAQELAQVRGVGQVNVGGGALPAVRVELNPTVLNKYGISLEQVRTVLSQANANRPKGQLADERTSWEVYTDDQLFQAVNYMPLIVAARNGAIVRLADLGDVSDSVENVRVGGLANGKPGVLVFVMTEPAANVIDTVDASAPSCRVSARSCRPVWTCASPSIAQPRSAPRCATWSARSLSRSCSSSSSSSRSCAAAGRPSSPASRCRCRCSARSA